MGATLVWLLHGLLSQAVGSSIFATVEGYNVFDTEKPTDPRPCQMVRGYSDPKAQGTGKGLFFSQLEGGNIIVTLTYTSWSWVKGSPPRTRFQIDGRDYAPLTTWFSEAASLGALFSDTLIAKLGEGKRIVVGVPKGNVEFDLSGFRPAFEALQRCNRAARLAPQAALPPQGAPVPKRDGAAPTPEAAPPPPAMEVGEKLAAIYGLTRHQLWATGTCGLRMNEQQKKTADFLISTLSYLPAPYQAAVDRTFAGMTASDCPSGEFLDRHLRILGLRTDEIVAQMDDGLRRRFLAIHAEAKSAPPLAPPAETDPEPAPKGATTAAPPAASTAASSAASPATAEELRVIAYFAGVVLQDGIERCDVATTPRQRAAISENVAALRSEMQDLDAAVRDKAAGHPCPEAGDRKALDIVQAFVAKSPENFGAEWNDENGGTLLTEIREMLAQLRPAGSASGRKEPARETAYLYGLVLRDVIGACEIRTTAKQRASFEAKMASLKADLAADEPALLERKAAFADCPSTERISDMETALPVFTDKTPEEFAAEMDRRAKAKPTE